MIGRIYGCWCDEEVMSRTYTSTVRSEYDDEVSKPRRISSTIDTDDINTVR